jgi:hypothetical protein
MCERLRGWPHVTFAERRTRREFAHCIRDLVDGQYPRATKIRFMKDNLNTHDGTNLYETFWPEEARRILDKMESRYTPKHGGWLNMAETGLDIMGRQFLDRRQDDRSLMAEEVAAWKTTRNGGRVAFAGHLRWLWLGKNLGNGTCRSKIDGLPGSPRDEELRRIAYGSWKTRASTKSRGVLAADFSRISAN